MAVYDRDADAATAVTAFLAQFTLNANGDIRFSAGTDTFHVWWLHRALQKKVWDFAVSGDDNLSLSKPNPSTSEALGTIITLLDHTTNYSVRYNIDDTVAQSLFGGSVEQTNVSSQLERYSGLIVLGSVNSGTTELQILQDGALYPSFWGTGINQTDANTLLRVLVKTYTAGAETDNSIVVVKASEWGDTYSIWETTLGLGEKVAAINTFADPQNDTALLTVQGYGAIAATGEGYDQIDVDGNGADNFLGTWSYAGLSVQTKKALFERVKSLLVRSTTETLFGLDGDLWTGRVYDVPMTAGAGAETWAQNDTVTWTGTNAGEGVLLGVDSLNDSTAVRMIIHLTRGVAPTTGDTITNGTASQVLSGPSVKLATSPSHLGVFTGSSWIGAYGIGFDATELEFGDSVTSLDGLTPSVPQNVTITVNAEVGSAGDVPHFFLAEKDPVLNAPDYDKYSAAGNISGAGILDVTGSIDLDEPKTGWVGVLHNGDTAYTFYEYTNWAGGQFTLSGTLNAAISATDPVFIAFLYQTGTGAGTTKTASRTFVFNAGTRDFVGWVRHGDPAIPDKPVPVSFTGVGSNSVALTVQLDDES